MSIFTEQLRFGNDMGLNPPQNWTHRSIEEIETLEQQNTALMAQVEEIREISQREDLDEIDIDILITESLAKSPQQSLESLKAKIEEETITRCKGHLNPITSGMIWRTELRRMLNDMPREYSKEEE